MPTRHPDDVENWPPRAWVLDHKGIHSTDGWARQQNCQEHPDWIDTSLLPIPYIGALRYARVVILMDSPAMTEDDPTSENPGSLVRHALVQTLSRYYKGPSFTPFYPFDRSFQETSAARQWRGSGCGQFGWDVVMHELAQRSKVSREAVQHRLAWEMAVLFLSPYRSFHGRPEGLFKLPSSRLALSAAQELLDEAFQGRRILLIASTPGRFGPAIEKYEPPNGGWAHPRIWRARHCPDSFNGFDAEKSLVDQQFELMEPRFKLSERVIKASFRR